MRLSIMTARIGGVAVVALLGASAGGAQPPPPPPAPLLPASVPQFGLPTPSAFTSKLGFFTPGRIEGASYPRVIQLRIGPDKGTLLATFARRGPLRIFRSTDNGD